MSEGAGTHIFRGREIVAIEKCGSQFVLSILNHDGTKDECVADYVFNAAGLYADEIARMIHPESPYRIIPVRGGVLPLRICAKTGTSHSACHIRSSTRN